MDVADVASRGIEELDAEFVIRDGERTAADTAVMLAQILSTSSAGSAGLCSSYKIQVHFCATSIILIKSKILCISILILKFFGMKLHESDNMTDFHPTPPSLQTLQRLITAGLPTFRSDGLLQKTKLTLWNWVWAFGASAGPFWRPSWCASRPDWPWLC